MLATAALTILLAGSAVASGSTVNQLQNQQTVTSERNVYAGHSNGGQRYAASTAPYGYNDEQGSHALGGGPG